MADEPSKKPAPPQTSATVRHVDRPECAETFGPHSIADSARHRAARFRAFSGAPIGCQRGPLCPGQRRSARLASPAARLLFLEKLP
jgi:hypothetical protein